MNPVTDIRARPPLAVISIIVSMGMLGVGNGLMFAYVPVRLTSEGIAPWVAGAVVTMMGLGCFIGCFIAGAVVRRVGHARTFAASAACIIISALMIALSVDSTLWLASRLLYGLCAATVFVVAQSWLNDASPNHWRGNIIGAFYMIYVVSIGFGGYMLRYVDLQSAEGPMLAVFFSALGILPICLTRLPSPPPPASIKIAVHSVWNISPVGLVGMLAVGGMTMLVQGFTPIYVAQAGYSKDDVGLLVLLMQAGMIVVQYPLGALSDRVDRRLVLIASTVLILAGAWIGGSLNLNDFTIVAVVFAMWAGATESVYSIANAHANDRAEPQYFVSLSSTMLIAWSLSGIIFPAIATSLTPYFGPTVYTKVVMAIALFYGLFVLYRMMRREQVPSDETVTYQQISAQMPYAPELSPQLGEGVDTRPGPQMAEQDCG